MSSTPDPSPELRRLRAQVRALEDEIAMLREQLAGRVILETRWGDQWPAVKVELGRALRLKAAMARRGGWWN